MLNKFLCAIGIHDWLILESGGNDLFCSNSYSIGVCKHCKKVLDTKTDFYKKRDRELALESELRRVAEKHGCQLND